MKEELVKMTIDEFIYHGLPGAAVQIASYNKEKIAETGDLKLVELIDQSRTYLRLLLDSVILKLRTETVSKLERK